ncbi:unnamed protein product [Allacma fusca]|uniref:TGF-beta family profile domain-containing protein n=1 Tax=Allacma fusca TaxID=39272 RepID=A0A8J2L4K6_9HEXA|nr:unnamed protein product [Allacma fusca]
MKFTSAVCTHILILWNVWTLVTCGKTPSGLYHDDGKGHTILTQRFSKKDVREISFDILNIMGFNHRPHPHLVDSRSPASQFLMEVYNSLSNEVDVDLSNGVNGRKQSWRTSSSPNITWSQFNVDQDEANTIAQADEIISFINRGHKFSDRLQPHAEDKQFWFDTSEIPSTELVFGAELRLWKKTLARNLKDDYDYNEADDDYQTDGKSQVVRISVKQVVPVKGANTLDLVELDEIVVAKWEQGWLRLNVTSAFREWILRPESNLGLVISTKCAETGEEIELEATGLTKAEEEDEHQPFVVAFLKGSESRRNIGSKPRKPGRRTIRSTKQKRNKKSKKGRQYDFTETLDRPRSCQMGMLYVNFEDLGWKDWVIAPDGFIAYYCHGECSFPLTASMNATNHAIVSTLVHTYYPLEYPKPSCSPVKLGSISMLYYDDNSNVTVKKYKDMVIKSCGYWGQESS